VSKRFRALVVEADEQRGADRRGAVRISGVQVWNDCAPSRPEKTLRLFPGGEWPPFPSRL